MFAFIYAIFELTLYEYGKIKEIKENKENKIKYLNIDNMSYIDCKGRTRLLSNNHIASYHKIYPGCYGDYVLEDVEEHKLIRNFSEEKRIEKYNKRKHETEINNKTTIMIGDYLIDNHKKDFGFVGCRFEDVKTKELYVIRRFGRRYYYLNINNGLIVRETDYSKENIKNDERFDMFDINIDDFNKNQNKYMSNYNWNWCSMYDLYS